MLCHFYLDKVISLYGILFVCFCFFRLFGDVRPTRYVDVTITGEGLYILTYTQHSWTLGIEVSLACHT